MNQRDGFIQHYYYKELPNCSSTKEAFWEAREAWATKNLYDCPFESYDSMRNYIYRERKKSKKNP